MNNADSSKYEEIRGEKRNVEAYDKFVNDIAINSKSDSKQFWKFVNGKSKSESIPCKLSHDEKIAVGDSDKVNLFAKFFASVYIERQPDNDFKHTNIQVLMVKIVIIVWKVSPFIIIITSHLLKYCISV